MPSVGGFLSVSLVQVLFFSFKLVLDGVKAPIEILSEDPIRPDRHCQLSEDIATIQTLRMTVSSFEENLIRTWTLWDPQMLITNQLNRIENPPAGGYSVSEEDLFPGVRRDKR